MPTDNARPISIYQLTLYRKQRDGYSVLSWKVSKSGVTIDAYLPKSDDLTVAERRSSVFLSTQIFYVFVEALRDMVSEKISNYSLETKSNYLDGQQIGNYVTNGIIEVKRNEEGVIGLIIKNANRASLSFRLAPDSERFSLIINGDKVNNRRLESTYFTRMYLKTMEDLIPKVLQDIGGQGR